MNALEEILAVDSFAIGATLVSLAANWFAVRLSHRASRESREAVVLAARASEEVKRTDKDAITFKAGYDQAQADIAAEALGADTKTRLLRCAPVQDGGLMCPSCRSPLVLKNTQVVAPIYCGPMRRIKLQNAESCQLSSHHQHYICKNCGCEAVADPETKMGEAS